MFNKLKLNFSKKKDAETQEPADQKGAMDLSVDKLALSNTITIEALVEVLEKKGILKKEELLEVVKRMGKNVKLYDENV